MTSSQPWWWRGLKPQAIWWSTRLLNEVGGLRVTSARRSIAENIRVHGVKGSGHVLGWCVDFVGTREKMEEGRRFLVGAGCRQVLIHDVGSGLHLHGDFRGAK